MVNSRVRHTKLIKLTTSFFAVTIREAFRLRFLLSRCFAIYNECSRRKVVGGVQMGGKKRPGDKFIWKMRTICAPSCSPQCEWRMENWNKTSCVRNVNIPPIQDDSHTRQFHQNSSKMECIQTNLMILKVRRNEIGKYANIHQQRKHCANVYIENYRHEIYVDKFIAWIVVQGVSQCIRLR